VAGGECGERVRAALAPPRGRARGGRGAPGRLSDRGPVEYARALRPTFKKIIMIVDESVRGDYLGINDPKYDNTPALRSARDIVANYGVGISATNYLAATL